METPEVFCEKGAFAMTPSARDDCGAICPLAKSGFGAKFAGIKWASDSRRKYRPMIMFWISRALKLHL